MDVHLTTELVHTNSLSCTSEDFFSLLVLPFTHAHVLEPPSGTQNKTASRACSILSYQQTEINLSPSIRGLILEFCLLNYFLNTHIHTAKAICPHYLYGKCLLGQVFFSTLSLYSGPYLLFTELPVCVCVSVYVCVCVCFQNEIRTIVLLDAKMPVQTLQSQHTLSKNDRKTEKLENMFIRMLMKATHTERERDNTAFLPSFWVFLAIEKHQNNLNISFSLCKAVNSDIFAMKYHLQCHGNELS